MHSVDSGELALCGCTVRIHDQNSVNLQTVHSRIAEHFQEMIQSGLLPHHFQLQVWREMMCVFVHACMHAYIRGVCVCMRVYMCAYVCVCVCVCVCMCVCVHSTQGSVIVESVLSSAVSDADIVVEAVVDNMDIKRSIFRGIYM